MRVSRGEGTRALACTLAISGLAAAVCVVLISHSQMTRPQELVSNSIRTRDGTIDLNLDEKKFNILKFLRQDKDVAKTVPRRMHHLTLTQIMNQNQQDVDDLRPVGPTAHQAVGPDGLRDDGSLADLSLLAGISHENSVEADQANAIDARHGVHMPQLFADPHQGHEHDMMMDANKIDTKAQLALAQAKSRNTGFKVVGGIAIGGELDGHGIRDPFHKLDSLHASDVQQIHDRFHAVPITKKEVKASQTASAEDWTEPSQQAAQQSDASNSAFVADLGEEGPAEALADPNPQPKADEGPGIWIEPGSNKGYDSFALDSLQTKGTA